MMINYIHETLIDTEVVDLETPLTPVSKQAIYFLKLRLSSFHNYYKRGGPNDQSGSQQDADKLLHGI